MSALLACHGLTKAHDGRTLFEDLSLSVGEGERLGLVGPNGAGKSTLLRVLVGEEPPDAGAVARTQGVRLAWVPQEDRFAPGATAAGEVEAALAPLGLEPHALGARVAAHLGKAGFGEEGAPAHDAPAATLSGGWRKRLALVRALAQEPDLVLLDEPTNHLDLDGVLWLERLLARPPFAFVLVTHDRYLLDEVCNVTVELDPRLPQGFLRCEGSLSDLVERREVLLVAQRNEQQALRKKLAREVDFLTRTPREQRKKSASRFTEAEAMSARLAEVARRNAHGEAVELGFAASGRRGNALVTLERVGYDLAPGAGGATLFDGLSLSLAPSERLGVVGPNGCGKSTLLRVVAGQLAPTRGRVKHAHALRAVFLEQDRDKLDPLQPLRFALAANGESVTYRGKPLHVTAWAKRFRFPTERLATPVGALSGGERARVLLARLMLEEADLLLLDEPTNDLDVQTLEVLEDTVLEFPGAVVLVAHDRALLDRVATAILGLGLGDGGRLLASVDQYARARAAHLGARRTAAREEARAAAGQAPGAAAPPAAARPVKLNNRERAELEGMEATIGATEARIAALEAELAAGGDARRLQDAARELGEAQLRLEALFARWQELESRAG